MEEEAIEYVEVDSESACCACRASEPESSAFGQDSKAMNVRRKTLEEGKGALGVEGAICACG